MKKSVLFLLVLGFAGLGFSEDKPSDHATSQASAQEKRSKEDQIKHKELSDKLAKCTAERAKK